MRWGGCTELVPVTVKYRKRRIICHQTQPPLVRVMDYACSLEHQLLHHRANPSEFRSVTHRLLGFMQSALIHQTQQIHGNRNQCAQQKDRGDLALGQPNESRVGLELRMKLLVCATVRKQSNDLLRRERCFAQGYAPALQHILGQKHLLIPHVDGALSQPVDTVHRQSGIAFTNLNAISPHTLTLVLTHSDPHRMCYRAIGPLPASPPASTH